MRNGIGFYMSNKGCIYHGIYRDDINAGQAVFKRVIDAKTKDSEP